MSDKARLSVTATEDDLRQLAMAAQTDGSNGGKHDEMASESRTTISIPTPSSPSPQGHVQQGESSYALMALSSLASLGSLPPVPNLAGQTGNNNDGQDAEPSGSGSVARLGAGTNLGIVAEQDHPVNEYREDSSQRNMEHDDPYHLDVAGLAGVTASKRKSKTGTGNKRKRKQDQTLSMGEDVIVGGAGTGGSGGDEADGTDEQGQPGGGKRSKRAEQNRKAQQAFRRRREEKIKELEEKAREMERLNSAIDSGVKRVGEVELDNEALRMENQFLRNVVYSLSRVVGPDRGVLTDDGDFILTDGDDPAQAIGDVAVPMATASMDTEDEVVRNLLNVSNEINAAAAGVSGAAAVEQDDRVAVALTRLREKSRVMANAVDMQRRQLLDQQSGARIDPHSVDPPEIDSQRRQLSDQQQSPRIESDMMQVDLNSGIGSLQDAAAAAAAATPRSTLQQSREHVLDPYLTHRPVTPITIVVSATTKNGIGCKGEIPWMPSRLAEFERRVTTGDDSAMSNRPERNTVIMSDAVWERLGSDQRGRQNRVVVGRAEATRNANHAITTVNDLPAAIESIPSSSLGKAMLIGGASLFREALAQDVVHSIVLTRILEPAYDDCDAFLPDLDPATWTRASHLELCEHVRFKVESGVVEEQGVKFQHELWVRT